jgi:uncharacterized protein (DUF305 family)
MFGKTRFAFGTAVVAVAALVLGGCSNDADQNDVMFAQMMIPHHEQAIEMADLALESPSASAEVQALAAQIKAAQGPEIDQMTQWLKNWDADMPMGGHDMGDMGGDGMMGQDDLDELEAAQGPEFDRLWLTMMIDHHEGALTMAGRVIDTDNTDVAALAKAIVEGQTAEIATMEGLLAE